MAEGAPKSGEYFDGRLWFSRKGSVVTLGLTNTGVDEVGAIEEIDFPVEGDDYDKGDVVLTLEGTKGTLEVTTPAAGVINEVNEAAKGEHDMVTEDPLEEGWLVKIEIQDSSDLAEYAAG